MSELLHSDKDEPTIIAPDTLKSEHLAEGIRPIMACVGTRKQYGQEIAEILDIKSVGHHSDYHGHPMTLNERGFRADSSDMGKPTYVISPIDEKPKFTENLYDCTSLVAVGRDEVSGIEVSFLTHQDPKRVLRGQKDIFEADLKETLEEFKDRCLPGSVDIVIAGGKITLMSPKNYGDSLNMLDSLVKKVFGFGPLVISGPKGAYDYEDDIYLNTQGRRLYIVRPDDGELHNDVFKPSRLDKKQEEWKNNPAD
jgi:hypothetical protein